MNEIDKQMLTLLKKQLRDAVWRRQDLSKQIRKTDEAITKTREKIIEIKERNK